MPLHLPFYFSKHFYRYNQVLKLNHLINTNFLNTFASLATQDKTYDTNTHGSNSYFFDSKLVAKTEPKIYDVFIIGGGVTGTALLYHLSKFTNLEKIALCERRSEVAKVASAANNNSQTIHCGDIETNYSWNKAKLIKKSADMLRNHITKLPLNTQERIIRKFPKMVLGVGEQECSILEDRVANFQNLFPLMHLIGKSKIAEVEPRVALVNSHKLRDEATNAILIENEHVAVNFNALAQSFIEQACQMNQQKVNIFFNTEISEIIPESEQLYTIKSNKGDSYQAKFVVVSSCGYSLLMAHKLGYGLEYSCMPVSGSFYFTPQALNGKVYTVQNPDLPFAAIHGDPDLITSNKTRFGPTGFPLPLLERYNLNSFQGFLQVWKPDLQLLDVYWNLLKNSALRNYILRNILFEIPFLNTRIFLNDVKKIVPSMELQDISYAKGFGGVRPQLIDKNKKKLLGEGKIAPAAENLIFNITPSPGATTCIGTAELDARNICEKLGATIYEKLIEVELYSGEYPILNNY